MFNPNEHLIEISTKQGPKPYLPVQWRLVWFREQCPDGSIETELVHLDLDRETTEEAWVWNASTRKNERVMKSAPGLAIFRATARNGKGGVATGTKMEKAASFPDFVEKAETGAIGRALAALGFNPQFVADEFDEEHRIVDAPIDRNAPAPAQSNGHTAPDAPLARPEEVEKVKSDFGLAWGFTGETIESKWGPFKVSKLGRAVADSEVTGPMLDLLRRAVAAKGKGK